MNYELDRVFAEFASCGASIRVKSELPTVNQCISEFKQKSNINGYKVTEDVEKYLYERLTDREEQNVSNAEIVDRLIEQVIFEKEFKDKNNKTIDVIDVQQYLPEIKKNNKIMIGFAR